MCAVRAKFIIPKKVQKEFKNGIRVVGGLGSHKDERARAAKKTPIKNSISFGIITKNHISFRISIHIQKK